MVRSPERLLLAAFSVHSVEADTDTVLMPVDISDTTHSNLAGPRQAFDTVAQAELARIHAAINKGRQQDAMSVIEVERKREVATQVLTTHAPVVAMPYRDPVPQHDRAQIGARG